MQHVLLAIVGGYALSAGLAALAAKGLAFMLPPDEAVVLMAMLAFLVYLAVLLWAFAERQRARLWAAAGSGMALYVLAHWLQLPAVGWSG